MDDQSGTALKGGAGLEENAGRRAGRANMAADVSVTAAAQRRGHKANETLGEAEKELKKEEEGLLAMRKLIREGLQLLKVSLLYTGT